MCAGGTNSCDHSNLVPCLGLYSKHIRCKFMINTQKGCIFVAPCEHPNLIPCVGLYIASMHAGLLACTLACHEYHQFLKQKIMGRSAFFLEGGQKTATMNSLHLYIHIRSTKHEYYNWWKKM